MNHETSRPWAGEKTVTPQLEVQLLMPIVRKEKIWRALEKFPNHRTKHQMYARKPRIRLAPMAKGE